MDKCKNCGERTAIVGIFANLLMVVLKFFIGFTSGSRALFADGLHSASNIITAGAILISRRYTKKAPNNEFMFGYGKIEFLAAGFISLLIIVCAGLLISVSIKHLLHEPSSSPNLTAILMAIISIIINEMLFRFMRCSGNMLKSQTILANAWANRADCFSSMAVIIGVIGSHCGIPHLDPIAAIIVVAIIIKISFSILKDSVNALMDASINSSYGEDIKDIAYSIKGVQNISDLMTRQIGPHVWAEMNIHVAPDTSMKESKTISNKVKTALRKRLSDIEKITLHIRPSETKTC